MWCSQLLEVHLLQGDNVIEMFCNSHVLVPNKGNTDHDHQVALSIKTETLT